MIINRIFTLTQKSALVLGPRFLFCKKNIPGGFGKFERKHTKPVIRTPPTPSKSQEAQKAAEEQSVSNIHKFQEKILQAQQPIQQQKETKAEQPQVSTTYKTSEHRHVREKYTDPTGVTGRLTDQIQRLKEFVKLINDIVAECQSLLDKLDIDDSLKKGFNQQVNPHLLKLVDMKTRIKEKIDMYKDMRRTYIQSKDDEEQRKKIAEEIKAHRLEVEVIKYLREVKTMDQRITIILRQYQIEYKSLLMLNNIQNKEKTEEKKKEEKPEEEQKQNSDYKEKWDTFKEQGSKYVESFTEILREGFKELKLKPHYLVLLGLLYYFYPREKQITEQQFEQAVNDGRIQEVTLVTIQTRSNSSYKILEFYLNEERNYLYILNMDELLEKLKNKPDLKIAYDRRSDFSHMYRLSNVGLNILVSLGLSLFYLSVYFKLKKAIKKGNGAGSNIFQPQEPNKKKFEMVKDVKVRFKDVAGLQESKLEVEEFVDFLRNPEKYRALGARIPKGALLSGPPGTGKTMLAKACAGEAGVPFFFVSGSDFVEMFVGVGASRVRDLFKQAKKKSPSIIFIDEIDAIGKKRQNKLGSNDEKDGTLNQLLVEMDGFGTDTNVIVMAATNRKEMLDNALTRPGRFDRSIEVGLPDLDGRRQIFMVHLTPLRLSPDTTMDQLARRLATLTPGFSGAEIANLCNEAAIFAARREKEFVDSFDFEMATQRVIAGVEKKTLLSEEEKRTVAVHESGHAVVAWFLKGAFPLLKVTIIPRSKGSLGYAQYLPSENKLETREELVDRLCSILGGRCAEKVFFGKITTGAADDLNKAYQIAHALVTKYGMSPKIGYIGYRDDAYLRQYSPQTAALIDKEIRHIIDSCQRIAMELVVKYKDRITNMSDELIKRETLDGKAINQILGTRPFQPHESYRAYLQVQKQLEEERTATSPPQNSTDTSSA